MNNLPSDILDEILFRLEPIYVEMMRCTNIFFRSYISDPKFDSNRFSGVGSNLFHLSSYGASYVYCLPFASSSVSMSIVKEAYLPKHPCYILGCCSGLLLIYIDCLFVANPLTKRFQILDHSGSKLLSDVVGGDNIFYKDGSYPEGNIARTERAMCVGFAVDRNQTTKRFKIVCILETKTTYRFEISDGYSWRLSETTIMTSTGSDLVKRMKPVYLDGTLHWLRNDGSIITFNPETEQARYIPSKFHWEPNMKLCFASDNKINCLTLISGTREEIFVYTLLKNPEWTIAKQIKNVFMEESELKCWNVAAYDGKRLLLREKKHDAVGVVHVYDMGATSWGVLGLTHRWAESILDFYHFTPSLSFVQEDQHKKDILVSNDLRISYLTAVMRLIDTTK